jgi:hypothetical protein
MSDVELPRTDTIAVVSISYFDPSIGETASTVTETELTRTTEYSEQSTMDPDVATQVVLFKAMKAHDRALASARAGRYREAIELTEQAASDLMSVGTPRAVALAEGFMVIAESMQDETTFRRHHDSIVSSAYEVKSGRTAGGYFSDTVMTDTQRHTINVFAEQWDDSEDSRSTSEDSEPDEPAVRHTQQSDSSLQKPNVSARDAVVAVRAGASNNDVMKTFGLSVRGLRSLLNKLLDAGLITQSEHDRRFRLRVASHEPKSFQADSSPNKPSDKGD